jgi:hypothetical protein
MTKEEDRIQLLIFHLVFIAYARMYVHVTINTRDTGSVIESVTRTSHSNKFHVTISISNGQLFLCDEL